MVFYIAITYHSVPHSELISMPGGRGSEPSRDNHMMNSLMNNRKASPYIHRNRDDMLQNCSRNTC